MPIAKPAPTIPTNPDDAPRADGVTHATVVAAPTAKPGLPEAALDSGLDDPYDNVACTD